MPRRPARSKPSPAHPASSSVALRRAKALASSIWQSRKTLARWDEIGGKARGILERALEKDPDNAALLTGYGAVLCDLGCYKEAARVLKKAVALGSRDRNTFVNLGVAVVNSVGPKEGREFFKKSWPLAPSPQTWEAYFDAQAH
jgi:Tfp pilus assembly protein PilF